ncbi:hypothetical protein [Croceibacterium aestuarii]|uniref:hypothetical protein n=1 Tax=Croceibacterium aestuarii TaxID=3064139 RepID=UPI00272DF56B|nr:hypothetical protein [Croceibacterium sp. D39]
MEWFWALFALLCSIGAGALAKWAWLAPVRWKAQGYLDNGLGTRIDFYESSRTFTMLNVGMRTFAVLGTVFVLLGVAVALGWIWKAI